MGQLIELPIRRVVPEVVESSGHGGPLHLDESFHAFALPSPVSSRRLELEIPVGGSVADVIKAFGIPPGSEARVCINDRIVAVDERAIVFPKVGDVVTVRVIPGFITASLAATLVAAGMSAATAATVASVAVTVVVGAVTSLVGKLISMALAPPSSGGGPKVSATPRTFSVSGKQNVAAPFSPIPKYYGTRQCAPQYAATPYIELVGGDQYLRMLFVLGYGPLDISQLKIKDSELEGFQDVEWELRAGFPDDSPPRLYPGSVVENDITIVLNSDHSAAVPTSAGWQLQTSGVGADELSVVVQFLNGYSATNSTSGDAVWIQMHLQIRYGPTGTTPGGAGWVNEPDIVLSSHGKGHVRRGHTWRVPRGQYDVQLQVKRFATENGNWANLIYQAVCTWTSITTIRAQAPFAMGGLALLAMRIRASRQLNGVVDSLNCVASSILPDYDSTVIAPNDPWKQRAGSWSYDYDNAGAGAASYLLDAANARTTSATTGKRFITDQKMGTADGATTAFSSAGLGGGAPFTQVPIQPGSLIISCGTKASTTSGPGTRKKSAGVTILPFIMDDGQGGIVGPTVTSGTINYATGVWTITFSAAPGGGDDPTADFVQLIKTAGAGRALAIKTTSGSADGAAVVSKSVPSKIIRANDGSTGNVKSFFYAVSGWYKASAAIAAGIRVSVLFGATEDFAVGAATSSTDILVNAPATTGWKQFTQTITIPGPPNADWMRLVLYHNPDGVGGVTVFFDDCSVMVTDQGPTALELLPNPSFDFPGRITSNPASHYRDILQGPANKQPLPDSRIDLPTLQAWWTNNEAAGHFFNGILDQPGTIFDVLKNLAPLGRAAYQLRDGLYSVVQDIPQSTIVQHFTPRNSWGFKGTFAFPNLPQALRVRWTNPANNWQPDERIVYDDKPDGSGPYDATSIINGNPVLFETLDLTNSVTDIDQAWREGRFHLAQGRLRPQVYELSCDIENLIAQRGDLIRVSHDLIAQGLGYARVKSVQLDGSGNCIGITLDESRLFMDYGNAYALRIRKSDGSALLENLTNPAVAIAPTLTSTASGPWATIRVAVAGDMRTDVAPSVRSSATGPSGMGVTTAAVTMPAGSLAGELLIVDLGFVLDPGVIVPPAGWGLLAQVNDGVGTQYKALFYKLSNGSEPGTYTFNWDNAVEFEAGSVCVSGADGTAPIDAIASQGFGGGASAAAPYPAAVNPWKDLILVYASQNAFAATLSLAGATAF